MSKTKSILAFVAFAIAAGATIGTAHAQSTADAAKTAIVELTDGEVRKIDKENKKITLKHGRIKSLDMPAMTMVFQVSDAALLDKVEVGDKVKFAATSEAGKLTVTDLQRVR